MNHHDLNTTDESIVAEAQKGDSNAFGILVDRYQNKLLRYGRKFLSRKEDIEDMVQNVFISAYQNIKSFDIDQKWSSWIYRIAHNTFVNALRKNKTSFLSIDFDTLLSHPVYDDPDVREREQKEMRVLIDQELDHIPIKYRSVLILHYLEELPYKDIAEILKVPIGTVGIRIKRAKEMLKNKIDKEKI
ncbi:MAG: RNA polymerase sigma factor [bacterium]|nr:RNA polymerase sigma factor [bacterium]